MLGTIVNTACIIIGSTVGSLIHQRIKNKPVASADGDSSPLASSNAYQTSLFNAMGLASVALGVNAFVVNVAHSEYPVLFIVSLVLGGLFGTWLDIDAKVSSFAAKRGQSGLAQGLTTACLLFCVGTLSIVGPIISALQGDNTYLYTNATLDLVTSTIFAATYGWGIMIAAGVLFFWQGSFYLLASTLSSSSILQGTLINELGVVGGILILCSGFSILSIKDCKTLNYLPALIVPVIWFAVRSFLI